MKHAPLILMALLAWPSTARAVVVISGDSNTSAPSGQPYFNNIGVVNGASGIYLGNGWVLSANHVAPTLPATATFGASTYATEAGTFHRVTNPLGSGLSTFTDIVLFRLGTDPGLPSLTIASSTPTVATDVMMIGNGRTQEASLTFWQRVVNPGLADDTWTPLAYPNALINAAGFKTTDTRTIRWGENNVATNGQTYSYGHGDVRSFTTTFNSGAKAQEAQGVAGDSGGGVFSTTDGGVTWTLSGMMVSVLLFENQPGGNGTAVLGNATAIADLSFYRSEILAVIPEPSGMLMSLVATCGLIVRRRR
ncbi:MAG: hypothetical protein Q8Q59_08015 [Luteolibacter sp.]|jgi:hypothetical protein|nr:hypothetical protein [Luteolibacter sp.]